MKDAASCDNPRRGAHILRPGGLRMGEPMHSSVHIPPLSCLHCGLIQTNTGYEQLFEVCTMGAQITDQNYHVIYTSANAMKLSEMVMRETEKEEVRIDKKTMIKNRPTLFETVQPCLIKIQFILFSDRFHILRELPRLLFLQAVSLLCLSAPCTLSQTHQEALCRFQSHQQ